MKSGDFAKVVPDTVPVDKRYKSAVWPDRWIWNGGITLHKGTVLRIIQTEVSRFDSKIVYAIGEVISSGGTFRVKAKDLKKI